jgi:hypothetical protein
MEAGPGVRATLPAEGATKLGLFELAPVRTTRTGAIQIAERWATVAVNVALLLVSSARSRIRSPRVGGHAGGFEARPVVRRQRVCQAAVGWSAAAGRPVDPLDLGRDPARPADQGPDWAGAAPLAAVSTISSTACCERSR